MTSYAPISLKIELVAQQKLNQGIKQSRNHITMPESLMDG